MSLGGRKSYAVLNDVVRPLVAVLPQGLGDGFLRDPDMVDRIVELDDALHLLVDETADRKGSAEIVAKFRMESRDDGYICRACRLQRRAAGAEGRVGVKKGEIVALELGLQP